MHKKRSVPTTGRSARYQVKQMGFNTVEEFCQSLPQNARVFDIGAGLSKLGYEVVNIRSDVNWVNIDTYYDKEDAPSTETVKLLHADITNADSMLMNLKGGADLVYSYWLLPHLSLENNERAIVALTNMKMLLKDDGLLCVGPTKHRGLGLFSPFRYKGVVKFRRTDLTPVVMNLIVQDTKLWRMPRLVQRFSNKHNIHLLKVFVGGRSRGL